MIPVSTIDKWHRIHFIGIGGIGMSGLAEYYLRNDYEVSGSDVSASEITDRLAKFGARISIGHHSNNVDNSIGTVVYSAAVKEDNPELECAKKLKIKTVKRAEQLAEVVNNKFLIAVAGTHGKTTTTAMIGKLLVDSGFDPLVFVGGSIPEFGGAASRYGSGNYAVVEADEYDRSFLTLKPDVAVITNIDADHLDVYKDLKDIKENFEQFLMGAKQDSKIIFCGDDGNLASFMPRVRRLTYSYGFDNGNFYRIDNYRVKKDRLNFSIQNSHGIYEDISLNLVGKHNALNSTACFAVAKILGIDFNDYRTIISKFKTVNRRLQLKYDVRGIKVYDDYAHHPKEIAASLSGLKDLYPQSRIITIFQPHLYSRTRDFHKELAKELSAADGIFLLEIYPAREEPIKNVNAGMIYKELVKKNKNTFHIKDKNKVIADVRDYMREGDVIVFQGAGDVTHVCDEFTQRLSVQKK